MPEFLVAFVPDTGYRIGYLLREQPGWEDHASFMDSLAYEGFIRMGGPGGKGPFVHLAVTSGSMKEAVEIFTADPWKASGLIEEVGIENWEILLGTP